MPPPFLYTDDMPKKILALMSQGLTLNAAAGEIGVTRQTLYNWRKSGNYPELEDAVDLGAAKRQSFWERRLLDKEITGPAVKVTLSALRNTDPENWRDRKDINHSSEDGSMSPVHIVHEFIDTSDHDVDE